MGRIIVIEDNPVFRDHVCGMLEKAGYKTRTAYDCAGARRLLEELDDGDIIVSDLRLPDGECTEVLERMREAGIRNPFVIMTDYAQVASAVSSMRLGAEDYIPKTLLQESCFRGYESWYAKWKEGIPCPYWSAEVPHSGPSTGVSHW